MRAPDPTFLRLVLSFSLVALVSCARGSGDGALIDGAVKPSDAADVALDLAPTPDVATDAAGGCATNEDCRANPSGSTCDTSSGRCVQCTKNADCPGSTTHCDTASHTCLGCTADGDCAPGTLCRKGACAPGCSDEHPCGVGSSCCASVCVNLQSDAMNCGACATACPGDGSVCCAGTCALTATSATHCGACGNACTAAHATPTCAAGVCATGTCEPGFGDCDTTAANGCEADLSADGMNCGACGRACASVMGATSRCMMGVCNVECDAARGDCDGAMDNGCESTLPSDPANCGACGTRCPAGPNATATCAMGVCGVTCAPGFGDCDASAANGCEVNLNASPDNCSSCGLACRTPNATPSCAMGRCAVATCNTGYSDCDSDPANGCEVNSASDSANCGMCGRRCASGTACAMGTCASVCPAGLMFCDGTCTQIDRDPNHCGGCGRRCAAGANGTATCVMGACALACASGFGDCNANLGDGCEINLRTDAVNCGACGAACSRSNATAACSGGTCRINTCFPGFANCNGADSDGCETNIAGDASSCGACGRACFVPNAAARCSSGVCAVGSCLAGYSNCNASDGDGCEVNLNADNLNCGGCGRLCPAGTACSGGTCASVCGGGTTFCSGACVDTQTNIAHCGACGRVCAAGQVCRTGGCITPGPANDSCSAAQPISMAASSASLSFTNVGAANDMNGTCGLGGGGDVFYSFTIPGPAPELVFADTAGATFDTVLYFAANCGGPITGSTTPGDAVCNDDMGSTGCLSGGLQSNVVALFNPGTYYLVLDGYGSNTGTGVIHFQHLPVGNGALNVLGAGTTTPAGTTSGTGRVSSCGGGSAPENTYWWRTCPEFGGGTFSANMCSRASWDTVIYLLNGNGVGNACNDDSCGLQSSITGSVSAGGGIHAFYVDGYFTYSGAYTVAISRP